MWTLSGTNTGPGGTGKQVWIKGFEEWRIGDDGLVAESLGHFDNAESAVGARLNTKEVRYIQCSEGMPLLAHGLR